MLNENTLFGVVNKVELALERLKAFESNALSMHKDGYWVGDSGGKDSEVLYDLVHRASVKATYHHSLTTVDAPQTIWHIRQYHPETVIEQPAKPLLQRMLDKTIPPMRQRRWCCAEYKERGGAGRFVVTGIRSDESTARKRRRIVETCYRDSTKRYLNPIIDWLESDVWEYINSNKLSVNPLYKEPYNFKRVGCVLCPMVRDIDTQKRHFPKLYEAWHRWVLRLYELRVATNRKVYQKSGEEYWLWWLNRDSASPNLDQTTLFE